jgi:protein gp37
MPEEARPVVEAARLRLFNLILQTPNLDWLLLTKRPQNIRNMVPGDWLLPPGSLKVLPCPCGWPANLWIGTSVEDQAAADERIPHLLRVPARVRFLSCEPLLGPVVLQGAAPYGDDGTPMVRKYLYSVSPVDNQRIHWVIAGGESGAKARPMHPEWARGLRDQAQAAGVAFFFKQWGEWAIGDVPDRPGRWVQHGAGAPIKVDYFDPRSPVVVSKVGKHTAGRLLDGRTWDEVPS